MFNRCQHLKPRIGLKRLEYAFCPRRYFHIRDRHSSVHVMPRRMQSVTLGINNFQS